MILARERDPRLVTVRRGGTLTDADHHLLALRAAASGGEADDAGRAECRWQRQQLPDAIRELVLDDQRRRNDLCWSVLDR